VSKEIRWSELVFSEAFFRRLKIIVGRLIVDETAAEETETYVIQCLAEDDWSRCRAYSGKSSPQTFLYSVATRLAIDHHRQRYGRQRPPTWLKRNGDLWVQIWNELCLKRRSPETIVDTLCENGSHDPESVRIAIRVIKGKLPWCGVSDWIPSDPDAGEHEDNSSTVESQGRQEAIGAAHLILGGSVDVGADHSEVSRLNEISGLLTTAEITPEEKLLLQLRYVEGLTCSAIARKINRKRQDVDRLLKQVLNRFRALLSTNGIDPILD